MQSLPQRSNYGSLTELSRSLNESLGDRSGRTISYRTAQGVIRILNANGVSENTAEDLAHIGMFATALLLKSRYKKERRNGQWLLLSLFICYHAGRNETQENYDNRRYFNSEGYKSRRCS